MNPLKALLAKIRKPTQATSDKALDRAARVADWWAGEPVRIAQTEQALRHGPYTGPIERSNWWN